MIIVNFTILVYLKKIDDCECELGERHKVLKGLVIYNIVAPFVLSIILILFSVLFKNQPNLGKLFVALIFVTVFVVGIYYAYALYKYIDDLDKSDCKCLKQPGLAGLHNFLLIWRNVVVLMYVVLSVVILLSMINTMIM